MNLNMIPNVEKEGGFCRYGFTTTKAYTKKPSCSAFVRNVCEDPKIWQSCTAACDDCDSVVES